MGGWIKRWLARLGVAVALVVVVPAACVAWGMWRREPVPHDSILQLTLDGPLSTAVQPTVVGLIGGRMTLTLQQVVRTLAEAAGDPRVKGLAVEMKAEALGLGHTLELLEAVGHFRKSGKWTGAFVETLGDASAGDEALALVAGCEHLTLSPPGSVYLGGLRAEVPFVRESLRRLKVEPTLEQRYEYKNFANTFGEDGFTVPHQESLEGLMHGLQADLTRVIAEGRHVGPMVVREWVAQAPFTAEAAKKAGLVDQVGYYDQFLAEVDKVAGRPDALVSLANYHHSRRRPALARSPGHRVAVVVVAGSITSGEHGDKPVGTRDQTGSDTVAEALRDAREDEVDALMLLIDSPGGGYIASDLIRREVERTREAQIPVVVAMGNVAASGGYFIASAADHIIAQPTTMTGSIGVVSLSLALRQTLEHFAGVHIGTVHTLPHAGVLSWLDPPGLEDRRRLGAMTDAIYQDFVNKVASGRHRTFEQVHEVARGRVWSGRQALERGLVDELGGTEAALAYLRRRLNLAAEAPIALVDYPPAESPLKLLRQLVDGQLTGVVAAPPSDPAAALWLAGGAASPALVAQMRGLVGLWQRGERTLAVMPPLGVSR